MTFSLIIPIGIVLLIIGVVLYVLNKLRKLAFAIIGFGILLLIVAVVVITAMTSM